MTANALLSMLRELEVELHKPDVRRDRLRLEELLHPELLECGIALPNPASVAPFYRIDACLNTRS